MDALTRKAYELRRDIIEMVHNSRAGHVGGDLSCLLYTSDAADEL